MIARIKEKEKMEMEVVRARHGFRPRGKKES